MPRTSTAAAPGSSAYTLLKTKIQVPKVRGSIIERPVLDARLDSGAPVTLVCAPPGSGKTTLLARWAARQRRAAWLKLDELDNDLPRFLAYLVATVQASAAHNSYSPDATVTAALNALTDVPLTLVLDDYHTISNAAIHDTVMFLIEHLPQGARLMIAGRTHPPLPLAWLRAAGELEQIDNLNLTPADAAGFLGLAPEDTTARALMESTEGWFAGLQLAALWRQTGADADAFGGDYRHAYDYFREEVFAQQPASVKHFLLCTSVLDALHAEVCDAVTGQRDGQAMLERLEQLNLFITPLDELRRAYRYHPLFAEFLRAWLGKHPDDAGASIIDQHLRASVGYERLGELPQAIEHALAAGAGERAAGLIERVAARGVDVSGWIQKLPDDLLLTHPALTEPLSERETEVLEMISTGMSNPEIASKLIIAVSTVKTHVKNIYRKLDVDSRYEAMQRAREMDLLSIRLERDYRRLIQ